MVGSGEAGVLLGTGCSVRAGDALRARGSWGIGMLGREEGGKGAGDYPSIVQQFLSSVETELKDADRNNIEEIGRFTASLSFLGESQPKTGIPRLT